MSRADMSPRAVTERLRPVSRWSDLTTARRLAFKIEMSPEAVVRRLRKQSELRRACLAWARLGEAHRLGGEQEPMTWLERGRA